MVTLRIRKTRQDERMTYTYEYLNGDKRILEAGKDGVTEEDIKELHAYDDSEVYFNTKNSKPNRTKEEKEKIEECKKQFVENFKEKYGYEPNEDLIQDYINENFPRNYNLSLDAELVNGDKSALENKVIKSQEFSWSEEMSAALDTLRPKQRRVIEEIFVNSLKKQEVAEKLDVSNAAVTKLFNKALNNIKKHYKKL